MSHHVLTRWTGFCASCPLDQPLLLVESGPRGVRGWMSGASKEDRSLSYVCGACGRIEQVPATEVEDEAYDATLLRWPDWMETVTALPATVQSIPLVPGDVFGLAAVRLITEPAPAVVAVPVARKPVVRIAGLPTQRVDATSVLLAVA